LNRLRKAIVKRLYPKKPALFGRFEEADTTKKRGKVQTVPRLY